MLSGTIFDLKEFAVHDGPGLRTTVFLKGCPLRCSWCHNPEGMAPEPIRIRSPAGERIAGEIWTAQRLAEYINSQADILKAGGGGVTFSGGEPLAQAPFVAAVLDAMTDSIHVLLDTSGYGERAAMTRLARRVNMVYFDLKLIDDAAHRTHTGKSNAPILRNLHLLDELAVDTVVRVPLVPGVTDTHENLTAIARLCDPLTCVKTVHLLSYNQAAGAKYGACGLTFAPTYDESRKTAPDLNIFAKCRFDTKLV